MRMGAWHNFLDSVEDNRWGYSFVNLNPKCDIPVTTVFLTLENALSSVRLMEFALACPQQEHAESAQNREPKPEVGKPRN
jgi:hypothetical protein